MQSMQVRTLAGMTLDEVSAVSMTGEAENDSISVRSLPSRTWLAAIPSGRTATPIPADISQSTSYPDGSEQLLCRGRCAHCLCLIM